MPPHSLRHLSFLLGLLVLATAAARAQTTFTFTNLGTLGGDNSYAQAINASGQVVGSAQTTDNVETRAVIWNNGTPTSLGTLGSSIGNSATGINTSGQIVGYAHTAGDATHAVIWNWNGSSSSYAPTDLTAPSIYDSGASGINASGQVVGGYSDSTTTNNASHPVIWNGGTPTILAPLGGYDGSGAGRINASGQIIGVAQTGAVTRAMIWNWNGSSYATYAPTGLATLGGDRSSARGINDSGQVVGDAYTTGDATYHAVIWNSVTPTDLFTLGGASSHAFGINASGQVVGDSLITGNTEDHAFFYDSGTMYDLNNFVTGASGWTLINAVAINDLGQIAGYALDVSGNAHAFLLTPSAIPEPSAYAALFGIAVLGVAIVRRRNRV